MAPPPARNLSENVATQLTLLISIDNMQAHTDNFQLLLIYQSLITN